MDDFDRGPALDKPTVPSYRPASVARPICQRLLSLRRYWKVALVLIISASLVMLGRSGSFWECSEDRWICQALHCPPPHNTGGLLECANFAWKKDLWAHEGWAWGNCTQAYERANNVRLGERADWPLDTLLEVDACRVRMMTSWGVSPVIYEFGDLL